MATKSVANSTDKNSRLTARYKGSLPALFWREADIDLGKEPELLGWNKALAQRLGTELWTPDFAKKLITEPSESRPIAMGYGGHQFGNWVPQLGDGRGVLLGEYAYQGKPLDIHLKGAGPSYYSRGFDGRAVLRSSIREYLASLYFNALKIPSTNALALWFVREAVERENGPEPRALVLRTAKTHIRIGHFEYAAHQGAIEELEQLVAYCVTNYWPEEERMQDQSSWQQSLFLLKQVAKSMAEMIAYWQCYGFCHGVMNTDNMSILGETFDFGPYSFLDSFAPGFICNRTDVEGRYAFNKQVSIGHWNLRALASALIPLAKVEASHRDKELAEAMQSYEGYFIEQCIAIMQERLGVAHLSFEDIQALWHHLASTTADYHSFFTQWEQWLISRDSSVFQPVSQVAHQEFVRADIMQKLAEQAKATQIQGNPSFYLRNAWLQEAIQAAYQLDFEPFTLLQNLVMDPSAANVSALDLPATRYSHWLNLPHANVSSMRLSCSS